MNTKSNIIALIVGIAVTVGLSATVVTANPSFFVSGIATGSATATTTLSVMTPGTGTTTAVYGNTANRGTESAIAKVCLTASSTVTTLNISEEYSDDSTDGSDGTWYANNLGDSATTSPTLSVGVAQRVSWTFASSTPKGGVVATNNNSNCKMITVNTPTKWTRLVLTLPVGSANAMVYANIIGKQQSSN